MIRLKANVDTNEIEANVFDIHTETFHKRNFFLNKTIKFSNLKYILNKNHDYSDDYNIIYLIVNTGLNSFYIIDYNSGSITDMPMPDDIGFNPTFMRLNKKYLISICGKNSDSIHIFDIYKLAWYYVGRLQSGYRQGSYALYDNSSNNVLICGGMTENGDNSLDIEYFEMGEFEKKIANHLTENREMNLEKLTDISYDYLLRKSYPMVLTLNNYKTFIICGGESLISDTDTCVIFNSEKKIILMLNIILPKPQSEENPNTFQTSDSIYFFQNDMHTVKYNFHEQNFSFIENKYYVHSS